MREELHNPSMRVRNQHSKMGLRAWKGMSLILAC